MMIQGYQLRPTTPSAVHIRSADPADPPVIEARYLETELDRTVTGRILARLRGMMAEGPLADLVIGEDAPGPDVVTPEQAVEYARATGIGIDHAVGSCAMGPNDEDVVDARLRVRGVRGLRVVDASVFPAMPSGNTAAPTMALAGAPRTSSAPRPDPTPPHPTRDDLDDCWPDVVSGVDPSAIGDRIHRAGGVELTTRQRHCYTPSAGCDRQRRRLRPGRTIHE